MKLIAWFRQQLFGNELDELQQQKNLMIGNRGFWLTWGLLLAAILLQTAWGSSFDRVAGEWVVFMIANAYGLVAWLRNGIWTTGDAHPTFGKNLVWSAVAGVIGFVWILIRNSRQDWWQPGYWWSAAVAGVCVAALCLAVLQLGTAAYYRRRRTLDNPGDDPDDDPDDAPSDGDET